MRLRISLHSHMSERDRLIVSMVCGLGHWPSEAVRTVCSDYPDSVTARFREALDGLADAFAMVKRHPNVVKMARP